MSRSAYTVVLNVLLLLSAIDAVKENAQGCAPTGSGE